MSGSIYVSELEIDKRLYVAGFDLHDAPDHRRGHQDLQNQRRMDHDPLRDGVDGRRQQVQDVTRGDQREDSGVARHDLRDHRGVEVFENLVQHQRDGLHRLGAEHQPPQADDVERQEHARRAAPPVHLRSGGLGARNEGHPELVQRQSRAVQSAPKDETHRRAVPQSAQQHRQEQVAVGPDAALAVAAQRDVEVVAQPRRERDVPPPPELGDRRRLVGCVEVFREAEAQQQGDADGHVRIAREVAVDLQRIAVDAHQALESRVEQRFVEDAVDEVERDVVRNDRLFEQAREDQEDARAEHLARDHDRVLPDLRDEIPGADDRAGHQLRKERQVKEIVEPVGQRLQLAAVNVYGVAHRLENEERDADREEDVLELQEALSEQLVGDVDEEVRVLEIPQHAEVHRDAQYHQPAFRPPEARPVDAPGDQEVARRGEDEQQEIDAARLVVEIEREGDDVDDAGHRRAAEGAVNEQESREEEQEQPAAENQRRGGVVGKQRLEPVGDAVRCGKGHCARGLRGAEDGAGRMLRSTAALRAESRTACAAVRRRLAIRCSV